MATLKFDGGLGGFQRRAKELVSDAELEAYAEEDRYEPPRKAKKKGPPSSRLPPYFPARARIEGSLDDARRRLERLRPVIAALRSASDNAAFVRLALLSESMLNDLDLALDCIATVTEQSGAGTRLSPSIDAVRGEARQIRAEVRQVVPQMPAFSSAFAPQLGTDLWGSGAYPSSRWSVDGALAQVLRLADALVAMVAHGSDTERAGKPLPVSLRSELEQRLGIDFGDVRVHDDSAAAAEASRHGADAFARGTDVFFADGMYDPSSAAGKQLIAHEVTHVAQQRGGSRAASGSMSEPGSAVEREADRVASAFSAGFAPGAPAFAVKERAATGTISRRAGNLLDTGPVGTGPKKWKPTLLGQTLDLSSKLAGARELSDGSKEIDVNRNIGPLRIQRAQFKSKGDQVESGTLFACIDSGVLKGSTGSLTVDAHAHVSGTLTVPINIPGLLFVKQVTVEVNGTRISAKVRLSPEEFTTPDIPIQSSGFDLTVSSTGAGNIEVGLTGSATVSINNGMAQGQAKLTVELHLGAEGLTFDATITGKLAITGLVPNADAVMKYDGKKLEMQVGATVPIQLPGLEGTANIKFQKGKLSLDSKDLHFTLPQLASVKFQEVQLGQSKLGAKLQLAAPIHVPLPGGASVTLEKSSIVIDGSVVGGDITGAFALGNAGGLTGKVQLAYERGGGISGSVAIAGGATFTVAGVQVTIDKDSKLAVGKGMGVSGEVGGKVKIPGLPEIGIHVAAKKGQPIDLTCDARFPLKSVVPQLGGDVHVRYHRGGGANAFSFDATDVGVFGDTLNGQVIFSKLGAQFQGGELTGSLTAKAGTTIQVGSTSVTILGGTVNLLPGKILDGQLKARSGIGGSQLEASVGWKKGTFDWSANGSFDLGGMTDHLLLGTVHATADSGGTGNFASKGPITFGNPALRGIAISNLSGNRQKGIYTATINAKQAVNTVLAKVENVHVATSATEATINYKDGKLTFDAHIDGSARYPKTGESQLEGNFHLGFDDKKGFTGTIDGVKIKASEYFESKKGIIDLETGKADLGKATFSVPGVCQGVATGNVNVKSGAFKMESDAEVTMPALRGLRLRVNLDNGSLKVKLREDAPPILLGTFATLTVGGNSTFSLEKKKGLSAHLLGTVEAAGFGKGKFDISYDASKVLRGNAKVDVDPFAMFDAVELDLAMQVDGSRKLSVSTKKPVKLALASQYATTFGASATVNVKNNKLDLKGRIDEVKNLGSISEAFKQGRGAVIEYDQASRKVKMSAELDIGGKVIPQLAKGSTLRLTYADNVVTIGGTLKPAKFGAVAFKPESHITASWTSATKRFVVSGKAQADIAQLCTVDFTVDAGLGGGEAGTFGLKGHINADNLGKRIPGITFSSVKADFSVLVGKGQKTDLDFDLHAQISAIPAAGVQNISASIDARYKNGEGISGKLAVKRAKLGEVIASGSVDVEKNKFKSGELRLLADFPSLKIEGTGEVKAGEMGGLTTTANLEVKPTSGSPISQFVQSGNIRVDIAKWKLTNALGQLHLVPPSFLPIEKPIIEVGYKPDKGLHAKLTTQFDAPMAKNNEKGTFEAGYEKEKGLYAHIEFPVTVPGFQAATVKGDLDAKGIHIGATLIPKDASLVKHAKLALGYDLKSGLYVEGSITLKPSAELELEVGLRYDQQHGLQVIGITPTDKAATNQDHEVANWHKDFPDIPLASIGVASLGLRFGLGVAAGYRMPRIKFKNPKLEGGLEALDKGGMPAITFGGQIAMGAYISLSLSVEVVGSIQLLIASADAGIGAEITARLNLELGADVNGRFAPGQGALLTIDPFVGASLDLIASLIATLHAEVCWFTLVDKKWVLASTNFAHIDLGRFHPFNPLGLQIGGPGGTHLTNGLSLRDDAFDQITEGVKEGGKHAGDEEANRDARERLTPVLQAFRAAAHQFKELPDRWEDGMVAPPVSFDSMFHVTEKAWDYYQDHADQAETIDPANACVTPMEKLAKAVAVLARRDPWGAGRLILEWRRCQIANKGVNPDNGVNVVEHREIVQASLDAKYETEFTAAQEKQKAQAEEHANRVKQQGADHQKAEATHAQTARQQTVAHEQNVAKTQSDWSTAQQKKASAGKNAQQEGAPVQQAKQEVTPPPPTPAAPPMPKPLAKPAPIPEPVPVPLPTPPETLPAVTLPALPADPGVNVAASMVIPPSQKKAKVERPAAKPPQKGSTPDPTPGTTPNAKQASGGGGGGPAKVGGNNSGNSGGRKVGGSARSAPAPGPMVAAGPAGIISQQKTLDAKKRLLDGGAAGPAGAAGKAGAVGMPNAPMPAPAPTPAAPDKAAPGAAPGADGKQDAKQAGAKPKQAAEALDPTVQKVVDQGKADEAAHKQQLAQQAQTYGANITQQNKATAAETQNLEKAAEAAKKRKEQEKAGAVAANAQAPSEGPAPAGEPSIGTRPRPSMPTAPAPMPTAPAPMPTAPAPTAPVAAPAADETNKKPAEAKPAAKPDDDRSKHAAGPPPAGWESKEVGAVPSTAVVADDPGHQYHLTNDGDVITTSTSARGDREVTDRVRNLMPATEFRTPSITRKVGFETKLGNYLASHPASMGSARDMMAGARRYFEARMGKPLEDALAAMDAATAKVLMEIGELEEGGLGGRAGKTREDVHKIGVILQGTGNLRELVTHANNFAWRVLSNDLVGRDRKPEALKLAEKANLGVPAIKQRLHKVRQMFLDKMMASGSSQEEINALKRDPKALDRELSARDMTGLADTATIKTQDAMRKRDPNANTWSTTPREAFEAAGGRFSPIEETLLNSDIFRDVQEREYKRLIPSDEGTTEAQRAAAMDTATGIAKREASKNCPWWEGAKSWLLDADDAMVRAANDLNIPQAAGLSGTTVRTIMNAQQLGSGRPVTDLRVMCVGYLLPINAHSYHEVMVAAGGYTSSGKPKDYLAISPPVAVDEIKRLDQGFFEWDGQS